MSTMLNLDALATPKKSVTIKGVEYPVRDMTVDVFIQLNTAAEKISDDAPFADQLKATLDMIKVYIPTIGDATLSELTFDQVTVLAQFVRGEVAAAEEVPAAEGEEAKKQ